MDRQETNVATGAKLKKTGRRDIGPSRPTQRCIGSVCLNVTLWKVYVLEIFLTDNEFQHSFGREILEHQILF